MASTPIIPFAKWLSGTNQNSIPANDNSLRNQILNGNVISQAVTAQPASPAEGDIYIIAATHTGAQWSTFTPKDLAIFSGGTWYAFTPVEGVVVNLAGSLYKYASSAWAVIGGGSGSAAGSDKQIQYNNGGAFGAEAGFEYDQATNTLTVAKVNESQGSSIASATTTDIGAATGNYAHITGTTTITGLGTVAAGARRLVVFDGALTLTHNATSLILPTSANITTAAGDAAICVSEGAGNWRITHYQRKDGTPLAGGGGGLSNWTESVNTSAPNATVPAVRFLAANAATNVDAVIAPKGAGALLAQSPDNTATGGNKRGARSVDWQMSRSTNTGVASGADSVVSGGSGNSAQAQYDAVAGGIGNAAAGGSSAIGGGSGNSVASQYGSVAGGNTNTISGGATGGAITGGANNLVSGAYGTAGGQYSTTRGVYGVRAYASTRFSAQGDAQVRDFTVMASTTNATPGTASADLAAAGAMNQISLPNDSTIAFRALVVARNSANGDSASWTVIGLAKRVSGVVTLVGTPTVTLAFNDSGAASWALAVTADNTNKVVSFGVTGVAATNIKWVVRGETVEVVG
jgi:hypothetical protein